jgi:hypothetical protein
LFERVRDRFDCDGRPDPLRGDGAEERVEVEGAVAGVGPEVSSLVGEVDPRPAGEEVGELDDRHLCTQVRGELVELPAGAEEMDDVEHDLYVLAAGGLQQGDCMSATLRIAL